MAIKLVVFDMAGTTVEDNQNVAEALKNALMRHGYDFSIHEINLVMGYAKPVAIRMLLQTRLETSVTPDEILVASVHDNFVAEIIRFYEENEYIKAKDGALDVFQQLHEAGIKVALDTGFSREIADIIFNRLGWVSGEHYDISITSDEVANGRPYPDMILRAMELLHIESVTEVAKVGDTHSDLQEGNAAGCRYVIGITTGAYTAEELRKEQHTHLVTRLDEILDIVLETASVH
jgi:phosphonatase-like hydrolase